MRKVILLLVIFSVLIISGCSTKAQKIDFVSEVVHKEPLNLEVPNVFRKKDIQWHIITEENEKDVFNELNNNNIDPVLFGLTDENYQNLSEVIESIKQQILLQHEVINQYKNYYESNESNKPIVE